MCEGVCEVVESLNRMKARHINNNSPHFLTLEMKLSFQYNEVLMIN